MPATSNFLIPNGTLVVEVIAFLIVLGVIARYVLPPLNRALETRQQQIRDALEAAEAARAEVEESQQARQVILAEARQQARDIVTQANTTAERIRAEAAQRAQQEHDRLVAGAQAEIASARQTAVDELSGQVGTLVLAVARQVIGREIDAASHRALIEEAVAALGTSGQVPAARSEG